MINPITTTVTLSCDQDIIEKRMFLRSLFGYHIRELVNAVRVIQPIIFFRKKLECNKKKFKKSSKKIKMGKFKDYIANPIEGTVLDFLEIDKPLRDIEKVKIQKEINRKGSLFLDRTDLEYKDKMEILRNAKKVPKIAYDDDENRFDIFTNGVSFPIHDNVHNVMYKKNKNACMNHFAIEIQRTIHTKELDNIILPPREPWYRKFTDIEPWGRFYRERKVISTVIIENYEKDLMCPNTTESCYDLYPERFSKAVADFAKLSFCLEVCDLSNNCGLYSFNTTERRIDIKDGLIVYESDNLKRPACRFSNLPTREYKNKDGNIFYKFILVDIDKVRLPDHRTVEMLFRFFPKHRQLILDTVLANRPELLDKYKPSCPLRVDLLHGCRHSKFSEFREDHKYYTRKVTRIKKDRLDRFLTDNKHADLYMEHIGVDKQLVLGIPKEVSLKDRILSKFRK